MVLTDPGQARNKKKSHLSGMFIYLGPSAVKKPYFFYLKQHQNVLLRFHVISGISQDLSKVARKEAHL